jgi:SRSO17 transposase
MNSIGEPPERRPPPFELSEEDIRQAGDELLAYHQQFAGLFFRQEQGQWGLKYLQGLVAPGIAKTMEGIALAVEAGNVRNMQQFIGCGAWDDETILDKHRELVSESLGHADGVLMVDGTDFPKKGTHSVGVARQYCGALGKIANCQAGVFLGYASEKGHTLLDGRLYLPQKWFEDCWQQRWEDCQVPDGTTFRSKPQLAWEMIEKAKESGALCFSWVTCDEAFGDNPQFLEHLERAGITYLADVSVSTLVWLKRPETEVPAPKRTGRPPSRQRLAPDAPKPVRVDELAARLPKGAWREYKVKDGEKGSIDARFAFVKAVAVRHKLPGPDVLVVFRRSLSEPEKLKVFLTNARGDIPRREVVRVSGMRWPIETCFEEAKGNLGMDEYQTRSWRGWHHHMTLVILAHHFLVRLKLKHKGGHRR